MDSRAPPDQSVDRFELGISSRGSHSGIGIGSVIAQQIDERDLHVALMRYGAAGG